MSRYAVLPAGSDRNRPRLTDTQLIRLADSAGPVNWRPYTSPITVVDRQRAAGGAR